MAACLVLIVVATVASCHAPLDATPNSSKMQLIWNSRILKAVFVTVGIRAVPDVGNDWRRHFCGCPFSGTKS